MNTSSACGTSSFHASRLPSASSATVMMRKFGAFQLVVMTQRPPWWSALYSTSRSRGAITVNSPGSAAGVQRCSEDTVLCTAMQM